MADEHPLEKRIGNSCGSHGVHAPSPILYDGLLYFTQSNQAILSCVDAKTGKVLMERTRLPALSNVYASLVGAGNHLYVVGRYGKTAVIKRTGKFDLVATNTLADRFDASPAVVGDQLFFKAGTKRDTR